MFRIETFVDDRKLPILLRLLVGNVIGEPKVTPVVNAMPTPDKKGLVEKAGSSYELFMREVIHRRMDTITSSVGKALLVEIGLSPTSYQYVIGKALEANMVTKVSQDNGRCTYTLVKRLTGPKGRAA